MERVPSVTRVLALFNSPKLMEWANRLGLNNVPLEEFLSERADIGNLLHSMICNYFEGNEPIYNSYSQDAVVVAREMYNRFLEFVDTFSIEPLLLEEKLYCDSFCGIVDFLGYVNGRLAIIDFKSGFPQLKHKIQVSAYQYLCSFNNIDVDRLYLLCLPTKSKSYIFVRVYDHNKYFEVFKRMLEIYLLVSEEIGELTEYI